MQRSRVKSLVATGNGPVPHALGAESSSGEGAGMGPRGSVTCRVSRGYPPCADFGPCGSVAPSLYSERRRSLQEHNILLAGPLAAAEQRPASWPRTSPSRESCCRRGRTKISRLYHNPSLDRSPVPLQVINVSPASQQALSWFTRSLWQAG